MKEFNTKFSLLIMFVLFFPGVFLGQSNTLNRNRINQTDGFDRQNVAKLNTVSLAFSNLSFFYERSVWKKMSVSLGVGYKYKGQTMKLFQTDDKSLKINVGEIRGFGIAPEVRYYLQNCNNLVPSGFYGGVYSRFTRYNSNLVLDYNPDDFERSVVSGDFGMQEFGYGIVLGYQLTIKQRFVVDFQFFGPRYSFMVLKGDLTADVSADFKEAMEEYFDTIIERFLDDYNFNLEYEDSHTVKAKFQIPNYRFGISIGYSF